MARCASPVRRRPLSEAASAHPAEQTSSLTSGGYPASGLTDHTLETVAGGQVRLVKRAEVEGGAGPLIRLFAPRMRRDTTASLAVLQKLFSH